MKKEQNQNYYLLNIFLLISLPYTLKGIFKTFYIMTMKKISIRGHKHKITVKMSTMRASLCW